MDQDCLIEAKSQMFDQRYLAGETPWDTGITPPELVELLQTLPPGRALDLGCGSGTNCIYLAQHGWQAVGVDFSAVAIQRAGDKAQQAGVRCQFHAADASDLGFLTASFDLVFDVGCLSSVPPARRAAYRTEVARLTRPDGVYLLYAHSDRILPEQVHQLFAVDFILKRQQDNYDTSRPDWQSSWYWMRRNQEDRYGL